MGHRARIAAFRFGLLLAACIAAPDATPAADPGAQGPWDSLVLKGGRVLHNARVLSDEGDSVVIRCDEGLIKVARASLPQAAAAALPAKAPAPSAPEMVMQPFSLDPIQVVPEPEAKPRPAARPAPAPREAPSPEFRGCTIESFTMKPFQNSLGCAEVVIQNGTAEPVVIFPGDIVCVTADGRRLGGRQIVTDGFPPVVKRREVVPPHASADNQVTFSDGALDISSVQWAR